MNKFADDTKVGHSVTTEEDRNVLQDCINKLMDWADKWNMQFNVGKCKTLHLGRGNPKHKYHMRGIELEEVHQEGDIGVIIHNSLKPSVQCAEVARRASAVLGQITRSFTFRDKQIFLRLYTQFVR